MPFFYFPHHVPTRPGDATGDRDQKYLDPDPYVLTADGRTAIFGVVDTNLGEEVGVLNFGWENVKTSTKSVVSAEDPAEALREQLDYFQRRYHETSGHDFQGLKVLLAQMSPQRARVLSARFPEFQVVIAGADEEQGTSETKLESTWSQKTHADVALLQKRDLFDQIPKAIIDRDDKVQQILDRLIWKGDLVMLTDVPGSALKKALKQSKAYAAEDSSTLSLADERWRQFEM